MSNHERKNRESLPLSSTPLSEIERRNIAQQQLLLRELTDLSESERAEISKQIAERQRKLGISDEQIKDLLE
jgi:uncharacterized protein YllA (UPF0747 family)